jgi:hypothetical protein
LRKISSVIALAFLVVRALFAAPVTTFPSRKIDKTRDRIPTFQALHRVYKQAGHSRAVIVQVLQNGDLKELAEAPENPHFQPEAFVSPFVYPSKNWRVKLVAGIAQGDPDSQQRLSLVYRDGSGAGERTVYVPSLGDETFGGRPLYYDGAGDKFYFLVTVGPTGARYDGLLQFSLKTGMLREVGATWDWAYLSPDQKWLLWSPGGYKRLGDGKYVYPTSLSIFSLEHEENLEITSGDDADRFLKWGGR